MLQVICLNQIFLKYSVCGANGTVFAAVEFVLFFKYLWLTMTPLNKHLYISLFGWIGSHLPLCSVHSTGTCFAPVSSLNLTFRHSALFYFNSRVSGNMNVVNSIHV